MKRLLCIIGLLLVSSTANATLYGGVEFPQGISSFADQVVSFTAGLNTVSPYNNPSHTLGAPDYNGVNNGSTYVSLGWGGSIIFKFTDNALTTSGNTNKDLWVYEIGVSVEPTDVYVSKNGVNWISVGTVNGSTSGVDIDSFVGNGITLWDKYNYVKLVDTYSKNGGYPNGGADIDAVGAIYTTAPVPEPSTFILIGAGLGGLVLCKRRTKK